MEKQLDAGNKQFQVEQRANSAFLICASRAGKVIGEKLAGFSLVGLQEEGLGQKRVCTSVWLQGQPCQKRMHGQSAWCASLSRSDSCTASHILNTANSAPAGKRELFLFFF